MRGNYFDFILPARVVFGPGKVEILPAELSQSGLRRAVIVTDGGIKKAGILNEPVASLKRQEIGIEVFDEVRANPHSESVKECLEFLRDYRPDCIIAIGGGSSLDTAKAVGICYANDLGGVREIQQKEGLRRSLPVIAVPTTSGTGSEVNYWAVISDPETNEKLSIGHPAMSPHMAIVDPELTLTLPRKMTLWTGLDAFTHALEAYLSTLSNRLSDLLALEAIKLVLENLDRAVNHGDNLDAREHMALASLLAGTAMQHVGLGLIHAMSHQVSGFYNTPHGLTNAKLLAPVFTFNLPEVPKVKRDKLDSLREEPFGEVIMGIDRRYNLADEVITVRINDLEIMSKRAVNNVNVKTNPREASMEEIQALYHQAFIVE
jgi:alcohol dehydrogenase class IV